MSADLEKLATSFAADESRPTPAEVDQADAQKAEAEANQAQMRGIFDKLALGLLRAARAGIARKLPEIRDEWPDALLEEPAACLFPVLKKRAGALMKHADDYPEEAALIVACIPLALGAVAAIERNQANRTEVLRPGPDGVHAPAEGGQQ